MRGYHVPRKAGWDTHGLPVEVEVEKELRIHGKAAIEQYGVEPFAAALHRVASSATPTSGSGSPSASASGSTCESAYVTYHRSYVESVWWALSELFEKGLLYQGHKVVWWWAQGGTALCSRRGRPGLQGRSTTPASTSRSRSRDDARTPRSLVWTTTPWTLPSNMYAAVNPTCDYVAVDAGDREKVHHRRRPARRGARREARRREGPASTLDRARGSDDARSALRYRPPFDVYYEARARRASCRSRTAAGQPAWRVIGADFVTLDSGTGIVHIAPAFGEDDYQAFRRERARSPGPSSVELFCAVAARRHVHPEDRPQVRRAAGSRTRTRTSCASSRSAGVLVHAEHVPPRVPVLLARRSGSAHPARAAGLVHPHDGA